MPRVSDAWRDARGKREAVGAVRAMSRETHRADLRAALERELAARGLSESPLWIEQTLDHLHDSRAEHARRVARGLQAATDLAFRAIRGLRQHRSPPDLTPPEWLDPPERAVYSLARNPQAGWTEVELDEGTGPYLEQAYAAIPRLFGPSALATAWLAWEDEGPGERLVVSLGKERVGTLSPEAAAACRPDMDGAAERDELPYVPARLTPRPEAHLLEIQLAR
jgi:hypothetical protein